MAGRIVRLYSRESQLAEPGTALVLTGRKERADDHVRHLYPTVRNARNQSIAYGSSQAHEAGSQAGTQARVNSEIQESS